MAKVYDVQVPYRARNADLKQTLYDQLVEIGVLMSPITAIEKAAGGAAAFATEVVDAPAFDAEPDPVSNPHKGMSTEDLHLTLQIKEMETHKQEVETYKQEVETRKQEGETRNKDLERQLMHLHIRALELEKGLPASAVGQMPSSTHRPVSAGFYISKHITLVPLFCESEVDYFTAFECIAAALNWPKNSGLCCCSVNS